MVVGFTDDLDVSFVQEGGPWPRSAISLRALGKLRVPPSFGWELTPCIVVNVTWTLENAFFTSSASKNGLALKKWSFGRYSHWRWNSDVILIYLTNKQFRKLTLTQVVWLSWVRFTAYIELLSIYNVCCSCHAGELRCCSATMKSSSWISWIFEYQEELIITLYLFT